MSGLVSSTIPGGSTAAAEWMWSRRYVEGLQCHRMLFNLICFCNDIILEFIVITLLRDSLHGQTDGVEWLGWVRWSGAQPAIPAHTYDNVFWQPSQANERAIGIIGYSRRKFMGGLCKNLFWNNSISVWLGHQLFQWWCSLAAAAGGRRQRLLMLQVFAKKKLVVGAKRHISATARLTAIVIFISGKYDADDDDHVSLLWSCAYYIIIFVWHGGTEIV